MKNSLRSIPIAALLAVAFFSCSSEPENSLNGGTRSKVLKVDYIVTEPQPLANIIQVTGSVLPNESAELTTQVAGKVEAIRFEEGELVRKGQTLLELDSREWRAQLQRLRSELEVAKQDLDRKEQLAEIKGVSESELEAAQLRVNTLEANIDETEVRLSYSTIVAPFNGRIGLRSVSLGAFISAGTPVATLVQENPLKLEFNVPERYAPQIKNGQPVLFRVSNDDDHYQANIYATEPMINRSSRALRVRARANNDDRVLLPGSYADVSVTLDSIPNALMVPTEAIIPRLDEQMVYRIKNGKAEEVEVKTGVRQPRKIQIAEGLQPGDTIMVTGLLQVRAGMPVSGDKKLSIESFNRTE